jgi:predicted helicase
LTDSLEEPKQSVQRLGLYKWLSDESAEAQKIKTEMPVMVVLGNPPYSGESQNKGEWILNLMEDYKKEPQNSSKNIPDTKWINNDYVKFIRFGQYFIHKNGEGILAYITDNSFLDSLSFRGMRYNLLKEFDKIFILNLHGNSLKKEADPNGSKDENVFDIMQGVSINIFVKQSPHSPPLEGVGGGYSFAHKPPRPAGTPPKEGNNASIFHYDLYGKRTEKYDFLLNNNLKSIAWKELSVNAPHYFFVPKDFSLQEEYDKGFKIDELFSINSQGIVPSNKHFTIQDNKKDLENSIKDFLLLNDKEAMEKYELSESTGWTVAQTKKDLTANPNFNKIIAYNDYPFDLKYTFFSEKSNGYLTRPRGEVMKNFVNKENIGLVVAKECQDDWKYVFITDKICSLNLTGGAQKYGAGFVFPLYLYYEHFGQTEKVANLNEAIVAKITHSVETGHAPSLHVNPEQIFDYIYAVLHSPSYREKYKEFLKIDFPRIPYPENAEQFNKLAAFGEQLRHLHLMETSPIPSPLERGQGVRSLGEGAGGDVPWSAAAGEVSWSAAGGDVPWSAAGGEVSWSAATGDVPWSAATGDVPWSAAAGDVPWRAAAGDVSWNEAGGEVANFPKTGNNTVENSFTEKSNNYYDNKVWINDTQYFDNVSETAWNFYIGGYQPAQKWLKDRKGRTLTYEDIAHYQKIIFVLDETDKIMKEIDLTLL